eukprot:3677701-Prymnesium_polylepis.1
MQQAGQALNTQASTFILALLLMTPDALLLCCPEMGTAGRAGACRLIKRLLMSLPSGKLWP